MAVGMSCLTAFAFIPLSPHPPPSVLRRCMLLQKNAFIFNAPDSLYFKAAKTLSDVFEKR